MQYLLIHWFFGSGNKSESLDGFSIGVKYTFKHWSSISSLILHSLLFSFPDNFITIPGNFLVCLAIIKDPFRNLKRSFNYFLSSLVATDLVVGTIMDPVSVAFHTSKGLQLNIVDIKILHILYFILCRYGQICGRIIASEVQNNGYLQARYLTSLSIWLAALGFSFAYFQLGFIFYSFILQILLFSARLGLSSLFM